MISSIWRNNTKYKNWWSWKQNIGGLVKKTDYDVMTDYDIEQKYIITFEYNKITGVILDAKIKKIRLDNKSNFSNVVNYSDSNTKLRT